MYNITDNPLDFADNNMNMEYILLKKCMLKSVAKMILHAALEYVLKPSHLIDDTDIRSPNHHAD